jgi:hypothetical protein
MRMRFLLVVVVALALPAWADAKGPASASITGPGLSGAVSIKGEGENGAGTPLGDVTFGGGFFPAVYGQSPDPMLQQRPKGDLGPRYTLTFVVPGPNSITSIVHQDVYPYAKPYPVTYLKPGMPFWDGQKTYGGWFLAAPELKAGLLKAGLPATAPVAGGDGGFWSAGSIAALSAGLAAALGLAAGAALLLRRRPRPAPAQPGGQT